MRNFSRWYHENYATFWVGVFAGVLWLDRVFHIAYC